MDKIEYIVFGGGAVRGIALCAAYCEVARVYKHYYQKDFCNQLKGVAGTSIGACLALQIVCNVPLDTMEMLAKSASFFDPKAIVSDFNLERFIERGCFLQLSILYSKIDLLFSAMNLHPDITFRELYIQTNKLFVCNTCDLVTNTTIYMSYHTTPLWKIRDALCMTMCIPICFGGVEKNGKLYYDGGVLNNYIMDQFPEDRTLGFRIDDSKNPTPTTQTGIYGIDNVLQLLNSLCNQIEKHNNNALTKKQLYSTIYVKTPGFAQVKMYATQKEVLSLWNQGTLCAQTYLGKIKYIELLIAQSLKEKLKERNVQ